MPSSSGISPFSWFSSRPITTRLAKLPSSAGISPLNSLQHKCNSVRLDRLPNSSGISPLSWFSRSQVKFRGSHLGRGQIGQVTAQFRRYLTAQFVPHKVQLVQLDRLPNSSTVYPRHSTHYLGGSNSSRLARLPCRRYLTAQIRFSEVQSLSDWRGRPVPPVSRHSTGSPTNATQSGWTDCPIPQVSHRSVGSHSRPITTRLAKLPSSAGISPLNSLQHRCNSVRLDRLPSSDGISPLNWFSHRYKLRSGWTDCPAPQVSHRSVGSHLGQVNNEPLAKLPSSRRYLTAAQFVVSSSRLLSCNSIGSVPGWTGCPTQKVSRHSTHYLGDPILPD